LPARKRKKIEPPKPDVAEKIDAGFTHGEFDRALKKVTKRQPDFWTRSKIAQNIGVESLRRL
jgi:hypothetical protein